MSIMAKTPSGYKKIGSAYLGERPVDKVFNANGDVVYALQRELTGVPPLLFKGKEQSELLNYRIYGDTVDGESVGDRTGNLFDGEFLQGCWAGADGSYLANYPTWICTDKLPCKPNTAYTLSFNSANSRWYGFFWFAENGDYILSDTAQSPQTQCHYTATSPSNAAYMAIDIAGYPDIQSRITPSDVTDFMLVEGTTPLPYEPYGYKVPVTVKGKNLWSGVVEQGAVSTLGDYVDVLDRIRSKNISLSPGVYTISCNLAIRCVYAYNNDEKVSCVVDNGGGYMCNRNTFTVPSGANNVSVGLRAFGSEIDNVKPSDFKWGQIEEGITATPYEPYHAPVTTPIYLPEPIKMVGDEAEYIDYAEQKLHRVRKNLLQNAATSQTINGVTFTVNNDGSVTCNGTSTSRYYSLFRIPCHLVAGNYTISGCPVGGSSRTYRADIRISPTGGMVGGDADNGEGVTIPIDESGWYDYTIRIQGGYTVDDVTFKPMIRKPDIEDDTYEPYIENPEVDVTLPALPTIKGTNTMSVDTEVQPSRMDIKGRIKSLT